MAKIETTFIRPKELYTPETGETKVVYDGYQNNPHELITEDGFAGALDTAMPTALAKAQVIETTWQELKDKRDNGQLIAGSLYRITDYNCTTTQENTRSAGHQFDIVLLALSEDKLAEEGWAMMNDNIYDVTFNDGVTKKCYIYKINDTICNIIIIDTMLGYSDIPYGAEGEIQINEDNKTANCIAYASYNLDEENLTYNYFQNSNLSAWKVWYCLDNDTSRFAWADDASEKSITPSADESSYTRDINRDVDGLYAWTNDDSENSIYTKTTNPIVGDEIYDDNGTSMQDIIGSIKGFGRGVIYRLIDEFNNDIKYDFKNIQFKRKLTNGQYDANGTETWCYTLNIWYNGMCQDASIVGNTLPNDEGYVKGVYDNKFGYATALDIYIEGVDTFAFALGDNVVLSFVDDDGYFGINSNTIGNAFITNTIGNTFYSNTIGNNFHSNTIGNNFESNTIGNGFNTNTIGNDFCANIIGTYFSGNTIGDDFNSNTIGNGFGNKTISNSTWYKNYGNNGVELATKNDIGNIETALSNI